MINRKDITVFILAAGLGTRLRPLTNTMPKVMVPLSDGTPLLEHTIQLFKAQGFERFVLNLHYLPEVIKSHFGTGEKLGVEIKYSDEAEEALETAGAMKKAEPLLSDPFILVYGDHLHFFDLNQLLNLHEAKNALATILLKRSDLPQNGDLAEVDPETKKIVAWHGRPHQITEFADRYFLNTGIDVFQKEFLNYIPDARPRSLDREILPPLIKQNLEIYGFVTDEEVLDLGTPEKYEFAKTWHEEKKKERS